MDGLLPRAPVMHLSAPFFIFLELCGLVYNTIYARQDERDDALGRAEVHGSAVP